MLVAFAILPLLGMIFTAYLAARDRPRRVSWTMCSVVIALGEFCWSAFALSDTYVNQLGPLREPFSLVPAGLFFVAVGLIGALVQDVAVAFRGKNRIG